MKLIANEEGDFQKFFLYQRADMIVQGLLKSQSYNLRMKSCQKLSESKHSKLKLIGETKDRTVAYSNGNQYKLD
jgi:hypothetical protein